MSAQLPQPGVDAGVVDGVESGVGTVERGEERQHMHPAEHTVEGASQECGEAGEAAAEPIRVRNQMHRVLHDANATG